MASSGAFGLRLAFGALAKRNAEHSGQVEDDAAGEIAMTAAAPPPAVPAKKKGRQKATPFQLSGKLNINRTRLMFERPEL